jgi:hypothetical protein
MGILGRGQPRDPRVTRRPQDDNGDSQAVCDIGAYELLSARIFANGFEG